MKGTVKWFNDKKGYGFIKCDDYENDIYIHFSDINKNGYRTLYKNDLVEFDYDKEKNKAINLKVINNEESIWNL